MPLEVEVVMVMVTVVTLPCVVDTLEEAEETCTKVVVVVEDLTTVDLVAAEVAVVLVTTTMTWMALIACLLEEVASTMMTSHALKGTTRTMTRLLDPTSMSQAKLSPVEEAEAWFAAMLTVDPVERTWTTREVAIRTSQAVECAAAEA